MTAPTSQPERESSPAGSATSVGDRTGSPGSPRTDPGGSVAPGPRGTGSTGTLIFGAAILAGLALLLFLAFVGTKPDTSLGETMRLMYAHVPVVIAAYLGIMATTFGSVMFLWKRSQWWDLVAASAAEVSALFIALTLFLGAVWGKPTWGVWWVWDARLTSTAMLLLLLLGYLAVRRTSDDPQVRGKRSAIVGLLLLPNVIIVNRSVEWWRSLHQDPTLFRVDPTISDMQMFTLVFGIAVACALFLWLLIHRFRLAWLQDRVEAEGLDDALVERRAEGRP